MTKIKTMALMALVLSGCSDPERLNPLSDRVWMRMQKIEQHCSQFAADVTGAEFVVANTLCDKETKEIEAKKKAWMSKVPEHLKEHVFYPGPRESSHCLELRIVKIPSSFHTVFRDCMEYVDSIQKKDVAK